MASRTRVVILVVVGALAGAALGILGAWLGAG
jgi:hypothetical protein